MSPIARKYLQEVAKVHKLKVKDLLWGIPGWDQMTRSQQEKAAIKHWNQYVVEQDLA